MVLILLMVVTPLSTMASALDQPHCETMQAMANPAESADMGSPADSSEMSDCCDSHDCANCHAPCAANLAFLPFGLIPLADSLKLGERFDPVSAHQLEHPPHDLLRPPIHLLS